jgi:hypothetical protein
MDTPSSNVEWPESSGSVDTHPTATGRTTRAIVKYRRKGSIMALPFVAFEKADHGVSRMLQSAVLPVILGVCLGTVPARAQDATWGATPDSGDWNTATNWSPTTTVPTGILQSR